MHSFKKFLNFFSRRAFCRQLSISNGKLPWANSQIIPCINPDGGEGFFMNPTRHDVVRERVGEQLPLLLTEGQLEFPLAVREPEKVMEEVWRRANSMSPILEGILHEPHTHDFHIEP
jgi:hypothetical protein